MIVAARSLMFCSHDSSDRVEGKIEIRQPKLQKEMGGFVECEVQLVGLVSRTDKVFGLDSLQAVSLAIFAAVNFLRMLEAIGKLSLSSSEDYSVDDDFAFVRHLSDAGDLAPDQPAG
jgi:hypothetical protein